MRQQTQALPEKSGGEIHTRCAAAVRCDTPATHRLQPLHLLLAHALNLKHGNVLVWIKAHHLGTPCGLVQQRHLHLRRAANNCGQCGRDTGVNQGGVE
eukprot:363433-Chlamydomonas_euryale.AAC.29